MKDSPRKSARSREEITQEIADIWDFAVSERRNLIDILNQSPELRKFVKRCPNFRSSKSIKDGLTHLTIDFEDAQKVFGYATYGNQITLKEAYSIGYLRGRGLNGYLLDMIWSDWEVSKSNPLLNVLKEGGDGSEHEILRNNETNLQEGRSRLPSYVDKWLMYNNEIDWDATPEKRADLE